MNKPDFAGIANKLRKTIVQYSPEILTGLGVAGFFTSVGLAIPATKKALESIKEEKLIREEESNDGKVEPLTKVDVLKVTWKCYVPTAISCVTSAACIIGATSVNMRRNAALATAYSLSETALKEYQEKVVTTIGDKKEKAIRDQIAQDKLNRSPVNDREVILAEGGNVLCYDPQKDRYFRSDANTIKKAINKLNADMIQEMYVSLNDFYYEIGLANCKMGDDLGWNMDGGLIDISFSAMVASNDEPCLVLDYRLEPRTDYRNLM